MKHFAWVAAASVAIVAGCADATLQPTLLRPTIHVVSVTTLPTKG